MEAEGRIHLEAMRLPSKIKRMEEIRTAATVEHRL